MFKWKWSCCKNDPLEESCYEMCVEEGVEDLEEPWVKEVDEDEKLQALMDFVLGPEREDEDSS